MDGSRAGTMSRDRPLRGPPRDGLTSTHRPTRLILRALRIATVCVPDRGRARQNLIPTCTSACLLSVFHGEWPGFRAHIDDAWLEHEYPDTMIVLALAGVTPLDAGGPGLPVQRVVYRTEVWRKLPLPPGTNTRAWSVGSIAGGLIEWCYFVKRGSLPIESHESHEIRPPKPDTARRGPRL